MDRGTGERASALWGRGTGTGKGRSRGASFGARSRIALLAAVVFAAQLATASFADAARMPKSLRDAVSANPSATYSVVIQGTRAVSATVVEAKARRAVRDRPGTARGLKKRFGVINGLSGEYTGAQLKLLDADPSIGVITPDVAMKVSAFSNKQVWPNVHGATYSWSSGLTAPTIAIVDSGVDATRLDLAGRVLTQVNLTSITPNSPGDGRGHGTFVAGIAAGAGVGYAGFAPTAKIVSLDVLADNGQGVMSDVIAAADWIYQNKNTYGIRVANFSLTGSVDSSFMYDPLCKAVEKLWFSGVVVVTSSGNYGSPTAPSGVRYSPSNDPFVITVGASDTEGTTGLSDDLNAPWSAYGYTFDGFRKPELGAAGRYMHGPVPITSTMYAERPERIVAPGYMWMSGTSFAAPIVAGAAAYVLSVKPSWTPDQVKGALMLAAAPPPNATPNALGVGVIKAHAAAQTTSPPNPNAALNTFLVADANGGTTPVFDSAAWQSAASGNAAWGSAAWESAAWQSAAWSSAAWGTAAWQSAAWQSAAWGSGAMSESVLPTATFENSAYVE